MNKNQERPGQNAEKRGLRNQDQERPEQNAQKRGLERPELALASSLSSNLRTQRRNGRSYLQ